MNTLIIFIYGFLVLVGLLCWLWPKFKKLIRKNFFFKSSDSDWTSEALEMIYDGSVQCAVIHNEDRPFNANKAIKNYETDIMKNTVRMIAEIEVNPFGFADEKSCSSH